MQGGVLTQLVDPGGGVPDLVGRGEVLPHLAVVADGDAKTLGIKVGDDPRPHGFPGVTVLAPEHGAVGLLPGPLADVVADGVAENVVQRLADRNVASFFADDHRQLTLRLDCAGGFGGDHDVLISADDGVDRPVVGRRAIRIRRRSPTPRRHTLNVAPVIGAGCVEHPGFDRGQQLHLVEGVGVTGYSVVDQRVAPHLSNPAGINDPKADLFAYLKAAPNHENAPCAALRRPMSFFPWMHRVWIT